MGIRTVCSAAARGLILGARSQPALADTFVQVVKQFREPFWVGPRRRVRRCCVRRCAVNGAVEDHELLHTSDRLRVGLSGRGTQDVLHHLIRHELRQHRLHYLRLGRAGAHLWRRGGCRECRMQRGVHYSLERPAQRRVRWGGAFCLARGRVAGREVGLAGACLQACRRGGSHRCSENASAWVRGAGNVVAAVTGRKRCQ